MCVVTRKWCTYVLYSVVYNNSLPWVIRSDSSDYAVGAVLFQLYTSSTGTISHQAIAFASKKYSGAAINWDTYKQEAYALYFAIEHLHKCWGG